MQSRRQRLGVSAAVSSATPVASAFVCEAVERRSYLAGTATVIGSTGADEIRMTTTEDEIRVDVNGDLERFSKFLFDRVSISGANGGDQIYIDSNAGAPVTVNAGGGADVIYLAEASGNLDDLPEPVTIIGAGDELVLSDAAGTFNETFVVNNGLVDRGTFGGVSHNGVATIRLAGGAGADTFDVVNTSGVALILDGKAGADVLKLNALGTGAAKVTFDAPQDFARIESAPGGNLTLAGDASLVLTTISSDIEGDVTIGGGFIVERGSQAVNGINYWRDRLRNGAASPAAVTPSLASSLAAATTANDAIGFAYAQTLAVTEVAGVALGAGDLLLRYALRGDADLDRDVDFTDLVALAQNYGASGTADWRQGDFNLSRGVDFADLVPLAQNYGAGTAAASAAAPKKAAARRVTADVLG